MKKESLKTFVSNRKNVLFMIFVLALCIRIVLGVFYAHWIGAGEEKIPFASGDEFLDVFKGGDSYIFNSMAKGIIEGKGLVAFGKSNAHYPPVYPIFLSVCYFLFGYNLLAYLVPQALISSLTAVLIYLIADKVFNKKNVSLIAAFLFIFHPNIIMYSSRVLSDMLYMFLLAILLYLLIKIKEKRSLGVLILMGLCCGITVLCRSVFIAFLPLLFIWIAMVFWNRKIEAIKLLFVVFVFISLFSGSWIYRNYKIFNRFIITTDSNVLWQGNNPIYDSVKFLDPYKTLDYDVVLAKQENYQKAQIYKSRFKSSEAAALNWIKENPKRYLFLAARRFIAFCGPYTYAMKNRNKIIFAVTYVLIFPLGFLGIMNSVNNKKALLLTFYIAASIALHTIVEGDDYLRYRMPVEMLITIFAAYGFTILRRKKDGITSQEVH